MALSYNLVALQMGSVAVHGINFRCAVRERTRACDAAQLADGGREHACIPAQSKVFVMEIHTRLFRLQGIQLCRKLVRGVTTTGFGMGEVQTSFWKSR